MTPGSGRSPGGGNGNPLQYSGLEYSMDRGAWWAADSGVTKSQTQLSTDSTSELMTRIFSCFSPSHSELCWALLEAFALNDTFWYQCKHQRCFTLHLLFFPCQCGKREHNLAPFARSSQLYGGSDLHSKGGHRDLERERRENEGCKHGLSVPNTE